MKWLRPQSRWVNALSCGVFIAVFTPACSDDVGPDAAPSPGFAPSFASAPVGDGTAEVQTRALWGEVVDNPARPMVAGTLTVIADGAYAVASDSERDVIYVVDLATRKPRRVALQPEDEPGRVVAGRTKESVTHAYVVLRRANAIVDLDLGTDTPERVATCNAPRGIAYDDDEKTAHVACANGELISYNVDDWSEKRRLFVAPDLRDVAIAGDRLVLTRYASAEVLIVDDDGAIAARATPEALPGCARSTVAHRLLVREADVYLAHQLASTGLVGPNAAGAALAPAVPADCVRQVGSLLTKEPLEQFSLAPASVWQRRSAVAPTEGTRVALATAGAPFAAGWSWSSGPVDFALGSNHRIAVSLAGNFWVDSLGTIVTLEPEVQDDAGWSKVVHSFRPAGMITSVALDADDKWLAFSREPAALYFEDQPPLFLGGTSVNNSAFSLFHMNTGAGVSCVSCHPEGGRDDNAWRFPYGTRLTLPVRGARAPFNWEHRDAGMGTLLSDVLYGQMEYPLSVSVDQANLLQSWLAQLPQDDTSFVAGPAVERGRSVFASPEGGCSSCHAGSVYTDYQAYDVATGGVFATPSLLGVGIRANFLHDGCAATLEDVFGFCGGVHQNVQNLKREQVEDLLAFLSSL